MPHLTRRSALVALSTTALAGAALAQSDDDLVQRAVSYLDSLVSVKGRFQQVDQKGGSADGTFYLARPGRARFEYDAPSSLLMTSDGKTVILTDAQRHTFQKVALAATPLAPFLSDHIRLDRGAHVTHVERTGEGFAITAVGPHANEGQITLFFAERPLRLAGWQVIDASRSVTRVTLSALVPIAPPPADFFTQTR